jgi:putative transposase
MIITQRHSIKSSKELVLFCSLTKQLYNRCNYLIRQSFFSQRDKPNKHLPDAKYLIKELKSFPAYVAIANTKTSKQTIRQCLTDWSNFFKSLKAYAKDKTLFKRCPCPPGYKHKLAQVIFDNETIKDGQSKELRKSLTQLTANNDLFSIKSDKPFKTVTVTPKTFGFIIDVTYDSEDVVKQKPKQEPKQKEKQKPCSETKSVKLDKSRLCTIDMGVNILAAITLNQCSPLLINGRIPKSFNHLYNKQISKLKSTNSANKIPDKLMKKRYFRFQNYFHHVSKYIISKCLEHGCGTIVIGRNKGWKQNTIKRLRKKNRKEFQSIPFSLLQQKIEYKAKLSGIEVVFVEEAYTSQASFFDDDVLPSYEEAKELKEQNLMPEFSGVRKKRGLYITKDGKAIHADINGSLNIGRKYLNSKKESKAIPESLSESEKIRNKSLAARPVGVNPLQSFSCQVSGKRMIAKKEQDRSRTRELVLQGSCSSQLVPINKTNKKYCDKSKKSV